MKKTKKKNAITLLALVITIIIMLLLAAIAIQMTLGENGLIAKSLQAQKEQARAELYDTAKLSYMSLNAKALENGQPSPEVELALSTTEFRGRYDIVGNDITDKKGTVIDTKENVLNAIMGVASAEETEPPVSWPKTVAGVTIPEEDKDKMIVKIRVLGAKVVISPIVGWQGKVDYGEGLKDGNQPIELNHGEHVIKILDSRYISIRGKDFDLEILQWCKTKDGMYLENVTKIYEPELDDLHVLYVEGKFTEIPEWLFRKKKKTKKVSSFFKCKGITSIPEDLFKHQVNAENFDATFSLCENITSIPENLFKYNTKATSFWSTFNGSTSLTTIPENLFKNNVNATNFYGTFKDCSGITSIPENLFKYNVNAENFSWTFHNCRNITTVPEKLFKNNTKAKTFESAFIYCDNLKTIYGDLFRYNIDVNNFNKVFANCKNLETIPENLFKYNTKAENLGGAFINCRKITTIPENLFKYNNNVITFGEAFLGCEKVENIPENLFRYNTDVIEFRETFKSCNSIKTIPENLFKYNSKAKDFSLAFLGCGKLERIPEDVFKNNIEVISFRDVFYGTGITTIPENLFKHNTKVEDMRYAFKYCVKLSRIPDEIIEYAKQVKQRGGDVTEIFDECTSASNYNSLPSYMK